MSSAHYEPLAILSLCVYFTLTVELAYGDGDLLSRSKREAPKRTCDMKFCVLGTHTACMQRSEKVTKTGISDKDKKFIVEEHNRYRSAVQPTATNMMKMSWDDEVAHIAQVWAETCQFEHDKSRAIPGRFSVGQNLAKGQRTWEQAMSDWHSEIKDFEYGTRSNRVGHFTQMVWASSIKIGCGYAECGTDRMFVCNYGPAGNVNGQQPFEKGKSCEACPGRCTDNLCDCGRKVCLNGGTMNLETCECKCEKKFHVPPACGLDCSLVNEPSYCGEGSHDWLGCQRYYNVPYTCPITCRTCPSDIWDDFDCGTDHGNTPGSSIMLIFGIITLSAFLSVLFS
ncbi:hypothetical protein ScPMuIL_016629 [Solemya velum]